MKVAKLIRKNLRRRPMRTALTILGVLCAMLLLVLVESMSAGLDAALSGTEAARTLIVYQQNRYCPQTSSMPEWYATRIEEVEGVASVLPIKVFLNNCRASLDLVAFQGAPAEKLLASRRLEVISGSAQQFKQENDAALVGRAFASRKGLSVGDQFRFGNINVKVAGTFKSEEPVEEGVILTHLDYLQRAGPVHSVGTVTQFEVKITDATRARDIARRIDDLFRSAEKPTDTRPQILFLERATRDLSEILRFARMLGIACVAVMLALVANTVLMSVQERVREFGVLRTLGFHEGHIASIVIGESVVLAAVGSVLGLTIAFLILRFASLTIASEGVPVAFEFSPALAAKGLAVAIAVGALAGMFPGHPVRASPDRLLSPEHVMGRRLPFDYAVRNLGRRRLRTVLTGLAGALVAALIVATSAFVRGLETSFSGAGQDDTAILLSSVSERDVVRSTVGAQVPDIIAASVPGIVQVNGVAAVSAEIHMGTNVRVGPTPAPGAPDPELNAFVRGVTDQAFLVHDSVTLMEGAPPRTGEVIVGRLVAKHLGVPETALAVGKTLRFEGQAFTIAGRFAAPGTTTEAEIWTPLVELRGLTRRDDSSVVFVRMKRGDFSELDLFAKRRLDLELAMIPASLYYRELSDYFRPIRNLAWGLAAIMALAGLFGGANTVNASVQDRLRELATLRALGYSGFALVRSLATEALVLAAAGGLVGLVLARLLLAGSTIRIAMSAFALKVDAVSVLAGFAGVVLLAILGSAPAAAKVFRLPIATALKEP